MAIDLNKPIGAPAAASAALPSKTTMNLLVRERKNRGVWKYVLGVLALALIVALFAKFAVIDVYDQVAHKQAELSAAQLEHEAVLKQLESYDAVQEEYHSYTGISQTGAADALQVMDMVARVVQPAATVTSASTSDGMLIVNVKGISLDALGKLANTLRSESLVDSVTVANAVDDGENVAASLVVELLVTPDEEGA